MSLLRNIATGLRFLFRKEQVDRELNDELSAYLEMEAAEKMKQGMSRMEALRTARLERGNARNAAVGPRADESCATIVTFRISLFLTIVVDISSTSGLAIESLSLRALQSS